MCGIAGFNLAPNDTVDTVELSRWLLHGIEVRGRDAVGAAWMDQYEGRPRFMYAKQPIPASRWINRRGPGLLRNATNALLHTRLATKGKTSDPLNNHPIVTPGVVGVHNGVIWNDDELFKTFEWERYGEVDSEAAFQLIDGMRDEHPADYLDLIEGSAALAWVDRKKQPGTLHLARLSQSPLAVAQTPGGSTVFASTMGILTTAARKAGITLDWTLDVPTWSYLEVRQGRIVEYCDIDHDPWQEFEWGSGLFGRSSGRSLMREDSEFAAANRRALGGA